MAFPWTNSRDGTEIGNSTKVSFPLRIKTIEKLESNRKSVIFLESLNHK